MAGISASTGLITGIPIEDTVNKLMAIAAKPRDLLKARTDDLTRQQTALDTLGSRLLSFKFSVNKLKVADVFQARDVSSSNTDALDVTLPASGTPPIGSFQVRPVQVASAQQLLSQRFDDSTAILGTGTFTFRAGGFLDQGIALEQLNSGAGVNRGKIRITDRSGGTAVIDLTAARSVDDVLAAINDNADIAVTASTNGDRFVLSDASGGSGNLVVQEVSGGTTAAGLGLSGVNAASNTATGADVFRLYSGTKLTTLNDGNGVQVSASGIVDLDVDLHDGSSLAIDLANVNTLGDVVTQINAASPTKLSAAISADGNRIQLTDLTAGGDNFSVANGVVGTTATDLGLVATTSGATISGDRLASGLRDSLLSRLNGGKGFGDLGQIEITNRNGASATVDLSTAETLGDVIGLINASGNAITASINAARNGIVLKDASGGSGNLVVANTDGTTTATKLGLAVDQDTTSVNSGAIKRQVTSEATLLTSLNGGVGFTLGDISITNSAGVTKSVDLNPTGHEAKTVGDVINAINGLNIEVQARINDNGDGVELIDTAGGASKLGVKDLSGTTAKSLNLTRASTAQTILGSPAQVTDGTTSYSIDLSNLTVSSSSIPLSSLNGGSGVAAGDILITDSTGDKSIALDLNGADAGITTVGQLVDAINAKATANGTGVIARIDDSGTGIYLEDKAGGTKKLTVKDLNSTAAADLRIAGEAKVVGGKQVIDGLGAFTSSSGIQTGLSALADKINALNGGVTAATVFDGTGYRLSITANNTGAANQLLIDAGGSGLEFEEAAKGQDALLLYGNSTSSGGGVLLSSQDNTFKGAVGGVDLTITGVSDKPVTVNVKQTDKTLMDTMDDIVKSYNALRTDLGKLTSFDDKANTTGLLFGTSEALEVDSRLSHALTDRYFGLGSLQSLEQLGLSIGSDGTLSVNKAKLQTAFDKDASGVETFFRDADKGIVAKLGAVVDQLAGEDTSVLARRSDVLADKIKINQTRLDAFATQLDNQQTRLTNQFYQLESIIAKLQQSQSALGDIQNLTSGASSSK
jgi:flagellar hook-associated protein 2